MGHQIDPMSVLELAGSHKLVAICIDNIPTRVIRHFIQYPASLRFIGMQGYGGCNGWKGRHLGDGTSSAADARRRKIFRVLAIVSVYDEVIQPELQNHLSD